MVPTPPSRREDAAKTFAVVPRARWKRIEEVFVGAMDLEVSDRERFVAAACGGDVGLKAEVIALLESAQDAASHVGDIVANGLSSFASSRVGPLVDRRIGPYRLVALLGEGGMGAVYLAERDDAEFRRHVAIKVLHAGLTSPDLIARFRDERQILADLDHPGIVRLIDGGTSDGMPYLVMEPIVGVPITQYADGHALSVRERIAIVRATCTALAYAHARHVVHRDIKPSNLLVTADGRPKLVDFGIAKLLDVETTAKREASTRTGVALLTPEYASPEQARGEAVTAATDIYSLGAVLYELLTGRPPQQPHGGPLATMKAICEDDPPVPSSVASSKDARDISRQLDNIVMKALRKEAAQRYASIEDLDEDLGRFLEGRAVSAAPPSWMRFANRASVRRKLRIAAVSGLVVFAVVASAIALRPSKHAASTGTRDMQRLTSQLGVLSAARFGPDERTIFYSAAWNGVASSIYTMRPGEPAREILPNAQLVAVARSGDLAVLVDSKVAGVGTTILRTGTLAQTDPQGRNPRELARDVVSADWSPGGELAITRWLPGYSTNGGGSRGVVEWPIGTAVLETKGSYLASLRVSPDGERIALLEGEGMKQIVVIDRSKRVTRLRGPHDVDGLAWHGAELWVANTIKQGERCVHALALDGSERLVQCGTGMLTLHDVDRLGRVLVTSARADARIHLKAPGSAVEREVQWHTTDRLYDVTEDGRRIVFGPGGYNGPLYIRDVDRDGSAPVRIGTGLGIGISPNGSWVTTTREDPIAGPHFITPTGSGREIARQHEARVKFVHPLMGGWSPDSTRFYNACITHDGVHSTCTFTLDGRGTITIPGKRPGACMLMRSISPDGKWMLGTDGKRTLELIALDDATSRELPDTQAIRNLGHAGFDTAIGWGADSRSLFVLTGQASARLTIEKLDLTTGVSVPWKILGPDERAGNVEFTGNLVFAGGDGYAYSFIRTLSDLYLMSPDATPN